jgi:hypothetical protein
VGEFEGQAHGAKLQVRSADCVVRSGGRGTRREGEGGRGRGRGRLSGRNKTGRP